MQLPAHIAQQKGFGLVESLVALVVVSVGMIGIAALYGQGLGASRTALFRTQAVYLASDMADRIRLNRVAGASYETAGEDNDCGPGGVVCTPAEMAAHDVWEWTTRIGQQLPGGAGEVLFEPGLPPRYTINVSWAEPGLGVVEHRIGLSVPDL
jgi:type IV pilus assembly protein PilV